MILCISNGCRGHSATIFPTVALAASRVFCLLLLCVLWAAPASAQDNALVVTVSADAAVVSEGATASFTVTLSEGTPTADVEVSFTLGGSAVGADYTAAASPLRIPSGTTTGELMLLIHADNLNESTETLVLALERAETPAGSTSLGASTMAEVIIRQSDAAEVVFELIGDEEVSEGEEAELSLRLNPPSADVVTVTWSVEIVTQTNTGTGTRAPNTVENPDVAEVFIDGEQALIAGGMVVGNTLMEAGNTALPLSILAAQDTLGEDDERVVVRITGVSAGAGAGEVSASTSFASLTIPANRASTRFLSVRADPVETSEGGNAEFTIELSGEEEPTADVTVFWYVAIGGFFSGGVHGVEVDDFVAGITPRSGNVTFSQFGSRSVSLPLLQDNRNESTETVTLRMYDTLDDNDPRAVISTGSAVVVVGQSDPMTYSIESPGQVEEGSMAVFTVRLNGASNGSEGEVTVPYTIAADAEDYAGPASGNVTFAVGTTGAVITVPTVENTVSEPHATLTVTLGATNEAGFMKGAFAGEVSRGTMSSATVMILDDDAARVLTVTGASMPDEGDAEVSVEYTMGLDGAYFSAATSVTWAVVHGTTTATDFSGAISGTVSFAANAAAASFAIRLAGDSLNETTETFGIQAGIEDPLADDGTDVGEPLQVSITDDDELVVTVSADTAVVSEGATASFTVTLSEGTPTADVEVLFTLGGSAVGGAADAGGDYAVAASPLVIAPGTTSGKVMLLIHADNLNESTETLVLALERAETPAGSTSLGASTMAEVIIRQSDAAEVVFERISGEEVSEGEEAELSLRLNPPSADVVTVTWSVEIVTQTNTGTGTRAPNTVENPDVAEVFIDGTQELIGAGMIVGNTLMEAGSTALPLSILAAQDTLGEDDERVVVRVTGVSAGAGAGEVSASTSFASLTIPANRASTRFLSVRADPVEASEGGNAEFTIELSGEEEPTADVTVFWYVTIGGFFSGGVHGTEVDDFVAGITPQSGNVTFSQFGSTSVSLPLLQDNRNESTETVTLRMYDTLDDNDPRAVISTNRAVVVVGQSDPMTYSIESPGQVEEGDNAIFRVILSGASNGSEGEVTVPYTIAADAKDYAGPASGTVTFAAGTISAVIAVPTVEDVLNESTATLTVTVGATNEAGFMKGAFAGEVSRGTLSSAPAMIRDDDALTVSVISLATTASEGMDVVLDVILSGAASGSAASIRVPYSVAPAAGITTRDYTITSSSLTIAAGSTAGAITVGIVQDNQRERNEILTVVLGEPMTVGADGGEVSLSGSERSAGFTIVRNTAGVRALTVTGASMPDEGDAEVSVEYTIGLSGMGFSAATSVTWAVVHGTTTATDFSGATAGTVSFAANAAAASFVIRLAGDSLNETTETFSIQADIEDPLADGGTDVGEPLQVSITDDDELVVTVSADTAVVSEGATASFTLTLDGGTPTADVDVSFTLGGSAGSADYTAAASPLTIAAGTTSGEWMLPIHADNLNESTETLVLELERAATSAGLTSLGASTMAEVTIRQSDAAEVGFVRRSNEEALEGQEAAFTLTLDPPSAAVVTVTWSVEIVTQTNTGTGNRAPNTGANSDFGPVFPDVGGTAIPAGTVVAGDQPLEAGDIAAELFVTIAQDNLEEDDERVVVRITGISAGTGAGEISVSTSVASLTIPANLVGTRLLSVRANPVEVSEGGDAEFIVELSGVDTPTEAVTVDWIVVDGGANPAEEDDFTVGATRTAGRLAFDSGGFGSTSVLVSILRDNRNESTETVMLLLRDAAGGGNPSAVISTNSAGFVVGQSDPITYSIEGPGQVEEGDNAIFRVTLSGAANGSEGPVTVPYTIAADAKDYAGPASGTVTFAAGTIGALITVPTVEDILHESTATLTVTLGATNEAGFMKGAFAGEVSRGTTSSATAMLLDDDEPTALQIRIRVFLEGAVIPSSAP